MNHKRIAVAAVLLGLVVTAGSRAQGSLPSIGGALPGPLPLFPASNWWNLDISGVPVDPGSSGFITFVGGAGRALHADMGGSDAGDPIKSFGIPYVRVSGSQPKVAVQFDVPQESDGVDHNTETSVPFYPIPSEAITQPHWIEGGQPGNDLAAPGDRHMLIVDVDNKNLYEIGNLAWNGTGWVGFSGAFFNMNINGRRPETWTSSDAAGLAILPGLIRYDEVFGSDPIKHAFRVTVNQTPNYFVYPASHQAGATAGAPPMGARFRLKASKDISSYAAYVQRLLQAMKTYGLIVADNGSNMFITGTYDTRWDDMLGGDAIINNINSAFFDIKASDFEVVTLGYRAWDLSAGVTDSPDPVMVGNNITYTATATNLEMDDPSAPVPAPGVVLTDTLPAGVTFVSAPGCTQSSGVVTCPIGNLAPGATATRTITVTANSPGVLTNTVSVSHTDPSFGSQDPVPSNNTATTTTTVQGVNTPPMITPAAPLSRQRGSPATVSTIATVSDAETPAGSLVVTTTSVPAGISVSNITNTNGTVTASVSAACNATLGANTIGLRVTDGGGMTADANLTVNVSANTAPTLGNYPATTVNHNSGTTVTPDAAPTDNGAVMTLTATAPGFSGTFSGNPSTGVITISNAGPTGSFTVTVTATDNCVAMTQRTFSLQVAPVADLSITKTDGRTVVDPAQTMTYTIVASNAGPDPVTGATVTDTLPGSITGATWTCTGGGGGSCAAGAPGNINDGGVILPMGGTATYTLTGTLGMAAAGSVSNTAAIVAPGGVTDPNTSNNSATDTDAIAADCGAPDKVIFADGRLATGTIAGSATLWFRVVLTTDRSYSVEVKNTTGDATAPGTMTILRGDDACAASSLVTRDTSDIDPRVTGGARRQSFKTPGADTVFHVKVVNGSVSVIPYSIVISDTTMYSPAWTTNGTFDTYYAFQNTTNALISGTLTLLDQTGATVQTLAINNIPAGGIFGTNTVSLGVIRNRVGNARFTHDGPPRAVQIKADMANFAQNPPFIQSVAFEAKREKRK
jgi:uncharacterized repeat protein (TIGR01451 family)